MGAVTTYGLTSTGWRVKTAAEIKAACDERAKVILGAAAGSEPDGSIPVSSYAGGFIQMFVDEHAALWEATEGLYAAWDPSSATGAALDALMAITGTVREPAKFSAVMAYLTGDTGTVLRRGRVATVTTAGTRFQTVADVTLAAATAWATSTAYTLGAVRSSPGGVYLCTTAGTSSGSGTGPSGTGSGITDGSAVWQFLGLGAAYALTAMQALTAGPLLAPEGTLVTIATPVTGWKGVRNTEAATPGQYLESDAAARIRRVAELAPSGASTVDGIVTALRGVNAGSTDLVLHSPPRSVRVFFNDTDATDADGLPPHSVNALILGGTDQDLGDALWAKVGGGTATVGSTSISVTDAQGQTQTVRFDRPTEIPVYVTANVTYDNTPGAFPTGGAELVRQAILTFCSSYGVGKDVRASAIVAAAFDGPTSLLPGATSVPGVLDVTVYIGTAPSPGSSTTITVDKRSIATFADAAVIVNATGAAP